MAFSSSSITMIGYKNYTNKLCPKFREKQAQIYSSMREEALNKINWKNLQRLPQWADLFE